ncbi:MAG TPA: phosphotransferase [Herpetosiphonaceae bacterium]
MDAEDTTIVAMLREALRSAYDVQPVALTRLIGTEGDKPVYLAMLPDATRWVVRVYMPANTRSDIAATARVLIALEEADYPAERLVHTVDDAPFAARDGWRLLVTRFVAGMPVSRDLPTLTRLGALLGRLHAQFEAAPLLEALPISERSIAQEMSLALDDLASIAGRVPPQLQPLYAALLAAIDATQHWTDLPATLIHSDFHPGNVLALPDGTLTVIDWDGAGTCPAILDLGFLLGSCHPEHGDKPDAAQIDALIAGYGQHHRLTQPELDGLFDAIRFRPLTFLAAELPQMVAAPGWRSPNYDWWFARYAASAETALLARAAFERVAWQG